MGLLSERSEDDDDQGDIVLVGLEDLDAAGADELVYELDEWSDADRALLRARLEALAVPHHWEETSLVVADADEAWIERIMDQFEDELATSLDEDVAKVAYDLSSWDERSIELLEDALQDEAVPHTFEGTELFVHEIDEERVDELVAAIVAPDDGGAPPTAAPADVMGALFVAADRIVHDPHDAASSASLQEAIDGAAGGSAPYGMDRLWWDGVQAQALELLTLLQGPAPEDDTVVARASALRDALRPYV